MESRWTILLLTVIGGLLYLLGNMVDVAHWMNTGFDMASYNPIILPISWGSWFVFAYMNWLRRPGSYYWFLTIVWLASNCYFSFGMITYWLGL